MATNLECEIVEGEPPLIPENPTPWQVQMRWFDMRENENHELERQEIRSWTVDAPSELVAKTIQQAMLQFGDTEYNNITSMGYQI